MAVLGRLVLEEDVLWQQQSAQNVPVPLCASHSVPTQEEEEDEGGHSKLWQTLHTYIH